MFPLFTTFFFHILFLFNLFSHSTVNLENFGLSFSSFIFNFRKYILSFLDLLVAGGAKATDACGDQMITNKVISLLPSCVSQGWNSVLQAQWQVLLCLVEPSCCLLSWLLLCRW